MSLFSITYFSVFLFQSTQLEFHDSLVLAVVHLSFLNCIDRNQKRYSLLLPNHQKDKPDK